MGRYLKGEGKLEQKEWSGFKSAGHMIHFLSKARKDDPRWDALVRSAKDILDGRKAPKYTCKHNDLRKIIHYPPHTLAVVAMHDLRRAVAGKKKGAGISESISAVVSQAAHLIGVNKVKEWIGIGPKHRPMTEKQVDVARALQQSYKPVSDRLSSVGDLQRLPEYDTDLIAVWRENDGQMLVTVHGTKLSASDILDDAKITAGKQVRSTELETLMQTLDNQGNRYDIAGHSLATQFIQNAVRDGHATGSDSIYLFNPASSPMQDQSYLEQNANDPRYTYFINEGDAVSRGLYQHMNQDTMDNRVHLGPGRWDPLSAHYMSQWSEGAEEKDLEASEKAVKANFKVGALDAWFSDNP